MNWVNKFFRSSENRLKTNNEKNAVAGGVVEGELEKKCGV